MFLQQVRSEVDVMHVEVEGLFVQIIKVHCAVHSGLQPHEQPFMYVINGRTEIYSHRGTRMLMINSCIVQLVLDAPGI